RENRLRFPRCDPGIPAEAGRFPRRSSFQGCTAQAETKLGHGAMAAILRADGYFFRKILAVVAVALVFTSIPAVVDTASAQEVIRRQNFFERLFGGPARRQQPPMIQPQPGA